MRAAWLVLTVLFLQTAAGSNLVEEPVRVEYVLLDVIASDGQGQPVTDLSIDDFKLTEGGKKIDIESLDILDLRVSETDPATQAAAARPGTPSAAPRYVLLLDLGDTDRFGVEKSYKQLSAFLDRAGTRPGFMVAIHALDGGDLTDGFVSLAAARRALVLDQRRRLDSAVEQPDTWTRSTGSLPGAGSTRSANDAAGIDLSDLEERFAACSKLAEGGPGHAANAYVCVRDELNFYFEYRYARTTETLRALELLAYRLGQPARPTFMLLVSPGFEIRPGRAAANLAREYLHRGSTSETPEFSQTLDTLPVPRTFDNELRRVVHACVSARVVFHTFDMFTFGVEESRRADPAFNTTAEKTVRLHGDARAESARGLAALAEDTGGTFHSGKTLEPMAGVLDQTVFIYTLGYTSPQGKPGAYRKIKLKCRRKDVRLLHRAGYFGS